MSWINFVWNAVQQMQIADTQRAAADAARDARLVSQQAVEQTFGLLAQQIERLALVCHAMWTLIQDRTDLTDRDLLARITYLDMKDGVADGRNAAPPVPCPRCGSMMSRHFGRCLFCGEPHPDASPFDPFHRPAPPQL